MTSGTPSGRAVSTSNLNVIRATTPLSLSPSGSRPMLSFCGSSAARRAVANRKTARTGRFIGCRRACIPVASGLGKLQKRKEQMNLPSTTLLKALKLHYARVRRKCMRRPLLTLSITLALLTASTLAFRCNQLKAQLRPQDVVAVSRGNAQTSAFDRSITANNSQLIAEGRQIFRYDTFGDEEFWGNTLKLHRAIAGAANGGVGPGVSP